MKKVLNLYAGIGGNRKLWRGVSVTAVENNKEIAGIYSDYFPEDEMIIGDAHDFLLRNFQNYDFIWSSIPCQTHSRSRYGGWCAGKTRPVFPDMRLYEEIIFLTHHCRVPWVIENVKGYYAPLIRPSWEIHRHVFWANFFIPQTRKIEFKKVDCMSFNATRYGFTLKDRAVKHRKDQILKNLVSPDLGLYILECAFRPAQRRIDDI